VTIWALETFADAHPRWLWRFILLNPIQLNSTDVSLRVNENRVFAAIASSPFFPLASCLHGA
jgi:hypothetical protein